MDSKRERANEAAREVNTKIGSGAVRLLDGEPAKVPVFPTGSLALDIATGVGGYAKGCFVELSYLGGDAEKPGACLLALAAVVEVQRAGGVAAWVDGAHDLDLEHARDVGLMPEKLLVSQPDTAMQALEIVEMLARSGAVPFVVVDSLSCWESTEDERERGTQVREMGRKLRELCAISLRAACTVLFVTRPSVRPRTFGVGEYGGNALKFYASMRLSEDVAFSREKRLVVKVQKNKFAAPFREARVPYNEYGVSTLTELLELGEEYKVLKRDDAVLYVEGPLGGLSNERHYLGRNTARARDTLLSMPPSVVQCLRERILIEAAVYAQTGVKGGDHG